MYEKVEKPQKNKSRSVDNSVTQKKSNGKQGFGFVNNRPEAVVQREIKEMANNRPLDGNLKGTMDFDKNTVSQQPIQLAGHKNTIERTDKGITKKTSTTEADVYEQYKDKLDVIPFFYRRSEENGITKIEIEDLFQGIDNPIKFDIKIGKITSSFREIHKTKSRFKAINKKIKMSISDFATGSSKRGWRLIPQDNSNRLMSGIQSKKKVNAELQRVNQNMNEANQMIVDGIQKILDQTTQASITFIAASVLIVIDPKDPQNSKVKLIDLAHPIKSNEPGFQKYNNNFQNGLKSLSEFFSSTKTSPEKARSSPSSEISL